VATAVYRQFISLWLGAGGRKFMT